MEARQSYHKITLAKINLSKEFLEVTVILEDKKTPELTHALSQRSGGSLVGAREGAVNPDAPACSTQFDTNTGGETFHQTNFQSSLQSLASFYHTTFLRELA